MPEDLKIIIGGNALPVMAAAQQQAPRELGRLAVAIATEVQRQAKLNVGRVLNTTGMATGNLRRGITVIPRPRLLAAEVGPQAVYGAIHEFGGEITPKHAQALVFRIGKGDGPLIVTQHVTIPKRPYLQPAMDKVQPQVPDIVSKQVEKLFRG